MEKRVKGQKEELIRLLKKKKMPEKKDGGILFECEKLQEIDGKAGLRNILPQCQGQEKYFRKICGWETTISGHNECVQDKDWCCGY